MFHINDNRTDDIGYLVQCKLEVYRLGSKRVQLSLCFDDTDFYSEFIKPWNDSKELKPLMYSMLRAYYENMRVREDIDAYRMGYDPETNKPLGSELQDVAVNDSFDDIVNSARQSLAMMSAMSEQLGDIADTSLDDLIETMDGLGSYTSTSAVEKQSTTNSTTENSDINLISTSLDESQSTADKNNESTKQDTGMTKDEIAEVVSELVDKKVSAIEQKMSATETSLSTITEMLSKLMVNGVSSTQQSSTVTVAETVKQEPDSVAVIEEASKVVATTEDKVEQDDDLQVSNSDINVDEHIGEDDIVDEEDDGMGILGLFLDNGISYSEDV